MGYGCGFVFGMVMGYLMFVTQRPEWLMKIVEGIQYKKLLFRFSPFVVFIEMIGLVLQSEAAEIKDEGIRKERGKLVHAYSSEDLGGILGRSLNSIPWKMGVMSRRVLTICGKICFFYPSLRARSIQPVKRYKNLLADIFPRSQRSVGMTFCNSCASSSSAIARDNNGLLPIHLASIKGHVDVVQAMLQYWPDSRELLNCHGQNILHVAAKSRGHNMATGAPQAYCRKALNAKKKQASMQLEQVNIESYKDRFNTLLLVSTLVATVTFVAGCAIPSGYNNTEPDQGMPTMLKHKWFHMFVFCDTIAMYSSIITAVTLIWAQLGDLNLVLTAYRLALPLLGIALTKARRK
ncbi:hypothetical protein ACSBR1_029521 [Camellia fascicularis]